MIEGARALGLLIALWGLWAAGVGGCGDGVYESVTPAEKRSVTMTLSADFVRVGDRNRYLMAFIDVDPTRAFVTRLDLGAGIEAVLDSDEAPACASIETPQSFAAAPLRLCMVLDVADDAPVGERSVEVELRVSGEAVIARSDFFVLPQR